MGCTDRRGRVPSLAATRSAHSSRATGLAMIRAGWLWGLIGAAGATAAFPAQGFAQGSTRPEDVLPALKTDEIVWVTTSDGRVVHGRFNAWNYPVFEWNAPMGLVRMSLEDILRIEARDPIRDGAVVSFLLWFTADFMLYGISNVGNLIGTVTDPLLELVPGAIAGGVIAFVFGRIPAASVRRDSLNAGRAA